MRDNDFLKIEAFYGRFGVELQLLKGMGGYDMKTLVYCFIVAVLNAVILTTFAVQPEVYGLTACQKPSVGIVDIGYNITDVDNGSLSISVYVYTNDQSGAYHAISISSLSGDGYGSAVATGTNRAIVWDAFRDWDGNQSTQIWVRVNASDYTYRNVPTNDMVPVPDGWFTMGDVYDECYYDDAPVHSVYVSGFWIARQEFTFQELAELLQWAYDRGKVRVGGSLGHIVYITDAETNNLEDDQYLTTSLNRSSWLTFSSGRFVAPDTLLDFPATAISWYGAMALCNYRSEAEGLEQCVSFSDWLCDFSKNGYRLPTEAEWEKAARGGLDAQHFPWPSYGASWRAHVDAGKAAYLEQHVVGFYNGSQIPCGVDMANGYGLYDMCGNAWEWCYDWYGWTYYGVSPSMDPSGPATGDPYIWIGPCRVIRSVWPANFDSADYDALGCAARYAYEPFSGRSEVGFRMARTQSDISLQYVNVCNEASSIYGPITVDTTGKDNPGIIQFSSSSVAVDENAGTATLTVMRMGGTQGTASVDYVTANGTAVGGTDFTVASGTLSWADGDNTNQTITVNLTADSTSEGDETFSVVLSNPVGATIGTYTNTTITIKDAGSRTPVYRLYSYGLPDSTYEHVWTTDWDEMATMSTVYGWYYEGVAWYAFSDYVQGSTPLYRVYAPSIRQHHYTVDGTEYYVLTEQSGGAWNGEGIQYYVYPDDSVSGTTPVYRFYHAGMGLHHFTISADEAATIQATPEWGYVYEDIAFYVYP